MNFHCNKLIHSVSNSAKPIFLTISTKSYFYHSEVFPFPCYIRWSLFPYILRGSFSKSKIHPCLTVVPFWQLLHLRVFILMGIPFPHALVFDITDVFWLPLKKWSQQQWYKWKGQPFIPMLASQCDRCVQEQTTMKVC